MKFTITGSLGHISKPLTTGLLQKGHEVTVISSKQERKKDIEALGALAAIGSMEDAAFLASSFTGADAVYTMVAPGNFADPAYDPMVHSQTIGHSYVQAIRQSGIQRVVHLSSIGAHLDKGSGLILCHRAVEEMLNILSDVAITFMRPSGFYYNLLGFVPMIKRESVIKANYGAGEKLIWVSPADIAVVAAEELEKTGAGHDIRYVASDELTGDETAAILGAAIGKPDLRWILISNEERQSNLEAAGLNPQIAGGLVEMFASQHNGTLTADYYRHRPAVLGNVKIADFAKEFAIAFQQK